MITKTAAFKQKILEDIRMGKTPPGAPIPSRHQYMRRFSCARRTIDAVIKSLTQDGYLVSKRGRGTFVRDQPVSNDIERLVILDNSGIQLSETGFRSAGIAGECSFDISVELLNASDCYARIDDLSRKGNAVVWVRPDFSRVLCMKHLDGLGIPQLLIGRCYGDHDFITTDAKTGIKAGLAELSSKARRFAFISERNDASKPYIAERQIAFYQACLELDLTVDKDLIFDFDESSFFDEVSRVGAKLLGRADANEPLGVFIANYPYALPLLTYAEANGMRCGSEFHILTFDVEQRLRGKRGVLMLEQQWAKMTRRIMDWLNLRREMQFGGYALKLPPKLISSE